METQSSALFGDVTALANQMREAIGQDATSLEEVMQRVQVPPPAPVPLCFTTSPPAGWVAAMSPRAKHGCPEFKLEFKLAFTATASCLYFGPLVAGTWVLHALLLVTCPCGLQK